MSNQDFFNKLSDNLNVYKFKGNLLSDSEVAFSFVPMNVAQVKRCLQFTSSEKAMEEALDETLAENVKIGNKKCDPHDLYIEDRFWILFNMRLKSRGETLETTHKCSKCSQIVPTNIDLTQLEFKEGKGQDTEHELVLSDTVSVYMDNIKRGGLFELEEWQAARVEELGTELTDEESPPSEVEVEEPIEESQLENQIDNILGFYALLIKSITISPAPPPSHTEQPEAPITRDDLTIDERVAFIDMLSEIDYGKIKTWVEENSFGVKLDVKVKCPICQTEHEEVMNLGNFF